MKTAVEIGMLKIADHNYRCIYCLHRIVIKKKITSSQHFYYLFTIFVRRIFFGGIKKERSHSWFTEETCVITKKANTPILVYFLWIVVRGLPKNKNLLKKQKIFLPTFCKKGSISENLFDKKKVKNKKSKNIGCLLKNYGFEKKLKKIENLGCLLKNFDF